MSSGNFGLDSAIYSIAPTPPLSPLSFLCRHVMLPKDLAKMVPKGKLMCESEWRGLGVQQSQGWVHYMVHGPEPHILLFRRPITDREAAKKAMLVCT